MKNLLLCLFTIVFLSKASAQKTWQPFAGFHLSINSDAYYVGPSFSAGVHHFLDKTKKWSFTPSVHYFSNKKNTDIDASTYESAKFVSYSIRANFNYSPGKKNKFMAGGGLGFQVASDECYTYLNGEIDKSGATHFYEFEYAKLMFTINFGYSIPLKKNQSIQFLISGIGPYSESDIYGSYIEILSVLDVGVRFVF